MKIPIVNTNDEIIGYKERSEVDYSVDIFRTASLWITNSNGDVLLAQRKWDKKVDPGKWAEAVGGTVEGDDSYEDTVIREAAEELGLENVAVHIGPKQYIDGSAQYFVQWYTATVDIATDVLKIQQEEVETVVWVPLSQLQQELDEMPEKYIPAMRDIVQLFA